MEVVLCVSFKIRKKSVESFFFFCSSQRNKKPELNNVVGNKKLDVAQNCIRTAHAEYSL